MFMFIREDPLSRDRPMTLSSQLGQLVRRAGHHSIEIRILLPSFYFHRYVKAGLHARMRGKRTRSPWVCHPWWSRLLERVPCPRSAPRLSGAPTALPARWPGMGRGDPWVWHGGCGDTWVQHGGREGGRVLLARLGGRARLAWRGRRVRLIRRGGRVYSILKLFA